MLNTTSKNSFKIVWSIENASILRKFTVLFVLMALIPLLILFYLYIQIKYHDTISLTEVQFNITLVFVTLGVFVGYFSMRSMVQKLITLADSNRKVLHNLLGDNDVESMSSEGNELKILTQSFNVMQNYLQNNIQSLNTARKTMHLIMTKVGEGITNIHNIDSFLNLILETVTEAICGKIGIILIIDESDPQKFIIKTIYGAAYTTTKIKIQINKDSVLGTVFHSKRPLNISGLVPELVESKTYGYLFDMPMICAPLVIRDRSIGVIVVSGRRQKGNFDDEELNVLFNLASQTAVAIENARLNKDMEKIYLETVSALALAVDAKDKLSRGHLDRVSDYCVKIATGLGLDEKDIMTLRDAARLHDLGKIGIPDEILQKKEPLTAHEWGLLYKHSEIGEGIIHAIPSLKHLCDIIRHHHEKLDGSGYPDGLKGENITPLVRILTVADIYDALTGERPYRKKMSTKAAQNELRKMKDEIDQDIVEVLIEVLNHNNSAK